MHLDLADLTGIKGSVEEFVARERRLDVLWNNAGVLTPPVGAKTQQVGRGVGEVCPSCCSL